MSSNSHYGGTAAGVMPAILGMLLVLTGAAHAAPAAGPSQVAEFVTANQTYANAQYAVAARQYEQLIARHGYSAPLLFDLGNAWLQDGQPGRAILDYDRALWLAPGDPASRANLRIARQRAGLAPEADGLLLHWASALRFDSYVWTGWLALLGLGAMALAWRFWPGARRRWVHASAIGTALALVFALCGIALRWSELDEAVVLAPEVPARIAPATSAGASFELHDGQQVSLQERYDGFYLVRTADGRAGWVSASDVAPIVARS